MHSHRNFFLTAFCVLGVLASAPVEGAQPGAAASVSMVVGNGQIVQENYQTTVPLTIRVTDAAGIPVSGVAVNWSIPQQFSQIGSLSQPVNQTDSNGIATTNFVGAGFLQGGVSFAPANVLASTSVGSVTFTVTVVLQQPSVQLPAGVSNYFTVSGTGGTVLPDAVSVTVQSIGGIDGGKGIPNVGLYIANASDASQPPAATCNAPGGIALSHQSGVVKCDLVLTNAPGSYPLVAVVAGRQFNFTLTVAQGQSCTFTLSPASQSPTIAASGGTGTVTVTTASGCAWTATTSSSFISISSGASGTGNGTVNYTVAANTGPARSGIISIAGQSFTVNQSGTGPAPISITTGSNLPGAILNSPYQATLAATGGTAPYTWSASSGLPPGLSLNSAGSITGTPTTAGNYTFNVTVKDSAAGTLSQSFTIVVASGGNGTLTITNSGFPDGIVGVAYQQQLTYVAGPCGSPFAPQPAFTLSAGTLPPGLSVQNTGNGYSITGTPTTSGTYNFTLTASNSCATASAPFSIKVTGTSTTTVLAANPPSLTFNIGQNVQAPPTQQIAISSTGTSVAITVTPSTTTGGPWLSVTSSATSTPATLTVGLVNYQSLVAGSYQGSISVTAPNSNGVTIPVTLNVSSAGLSLTPTTLTFNLFSNTFSQQTVSVLSTAGRFNSAPPRKRQEATGSACNRASVRHRVRSSSKPTPRGSYPANIRVWSQ